MSDKNILKSKYLNTSKDKHIDFYNIPLIGLVRVKDHEDKTVKFNLTELISNYPGKNNNQLTLQVLDNAMMNDSIIKGDFINIALDLKLKDGDIVVVALGERIYIRRYYTEKHLIRLETSDEYHSPLVIDPKTPGFKLIGKVVSITRQL
jgi:SOS-response transcriptional repressor LexA